MSLSFSVGFFFLLVKSYGFPVDKFKERFKIESIEKVCEK